MSHPQAPYSNRLGESSRSSYNEHDARSCPQPKHAQETAHAMGGHHHMYNVAQANSRFDEDDAFSNNPAQHKPGPSPYYDHYIKVTRRFGGDGAGPRPWNEKPTSERTRDASQHRSHESRCPNQPDYFAATLKPYHGQPGTNSGGINQEQRLDPYHDSPSMGPTGVAESQHLDPYDSVGYIRSDGLAYKYEGM